MGTVLGVAALVATLGLARTAGTQIVTRFDELAATSVQVRPAGQGGFAGADTTVRSSIPWDAGDRLARLNGVRSAGTYTALGTKASRTVPLVDPTGRDVVQLPVVAVSGGTFDAVRARVRTGRFFDDGHNVRRDPVAVLGPAAAQRLNVTRVDQGPVVFVDERPLIIVGILDGVVRQPELLGAVIIPDGIARTRFGLRAPAEVQVDVAVGAAELIGSQAALALDPNQPERLRVAVPRSPRGVQEQVQADVNGLFVVLGAISLLIGAIGIANITLVSVLERVGEIGLRRAVGAARRHVAAQFLVESAAVGLLGGIIGASGGVLTVVAVSAARGWTPVLDPWLPLAAPLSGLAIGLLAGAYPAWKATAIEPITALRQGT
ncbi:MAG: ABC transporter permease [Acidimicrobiales bacterium]|nr:ABC transporter permease [Acidimicrobiales bacterium]